jgi:hypothetical protein
MSGHIMYIYININFYEKLRKTFNFLIMKQKTCNNFYIASIKQEFYFFIIFICSSINLFYQYLLQRFYFQKKY